MPDRPVPPSRWAERRSSVIAALFLFSLLVVGETIGAALLTWTMAPGDLLPLTAMLVAWNLAGLGVVALWKRITRKRHQYRRTG